MKRYKTGVLITALSCSGTVFGLTGIPIPEMAHCDTLVTEFLDSYDIPGASIAISKNGNAVYERGFGHVDLSKTVSTQPYHLFRIASLSKPITSIALMKMMESGLVSLDDKVFGPTGILADNSYFNAANVTDTRINEITISHLLEHRGGWDRDIDCFTEPPAPYPWTINGCDPISFPLHVTDALGESNPVNERALVRFLIERNLDYDPGTQYAYSNIGYLMLGAVIEEVTGLTYEDYVKRTLLEPLGIFDMHLAKNLLIDKQERESEYTGNGFTTLSAYGDGTFIPWEYGGFNVEAMGAHGGWIATARDLVRLLVAIDGFNTKPDILSSTSIDAMTTPSFAGSNYAKGWLVNSSNNWWHNGSLDGTQTIMVRTSGGYTWALLLNKRVNGSRISAFGTDLDQLPWRCVNQSTSFPNHDLLDMPDQNSGNLSVSESGTHDLVISWNSGSGEKRVLIASEGTPVSQFPLDGVDYAGNAVFGQGQDLGNGNYVVYNASGTSATVSGLTPAATYYFRLFDYNQRTEGGNHALYQLARSTQVSGVVSATCENLDASVCAPADNDTSVDPIDNNDSQVSSSGGGSVSLLLLFVCAIRIWYRESRLA